LACILSWASLGFLVSLSCAAEKNASSRTAQSLELERLTVEVLAEYPHDRRAFTQGLVWSGGNIYESTGQYGKSTLKKVELEDGKVLKQVNLSPRYFGEGLALVEGRLIQLTWLEQVALVYDVETLNEVQRIEYQGQGWGLTYDGSWLVMSDGTDVLTFRDPKTLSVWRRLPVVMGGRPVHRLNELEYVAGSIYANIWQATEIVRIDPQNGQVTAVIDAANLPYTPGRSREDVLNGIAFIPERETFLLTGKLWPKVFEVKFVED
jgi:glutamine cyclotransferase